MVLSGVTPAHALNVFGKDDRVPMESTAYPWSAIGKLKVNLKDGRSYACSAALVGKDLILTAAHCVFEENGDPKGASVFFSANDQAGKSLGTSEATVVDAGTRTPTGYNRELDWALLRLKAPLGDQVGYLGCLNTNFAIAREQATPVIHVGYSTDFQGGQMAGIHQGCRIRAYQMEDRLESDCDWRAGASGGPIFRSAQSSDGSYDPEKTHIVAISVAEKYQSAGVKWPDGVEFEHKTANIAVPATAFCDRMLELRDKKTDGE